jgi:hypothetical protein
MKYVILRDDDTNALTPISCLERLYRPFLDRGLPVNLATIPLVNPQVRLPDGRREQFAPPAAAHLSSPVPIGSNRQLLEYLHGNGGYRIVQHGFHHDYFEFDSHDAAELTRRLDEGTRLLAEAGFAKPSTFVAPYDKLSRTSMRLVAERFKVVSTGWFELERLPIFWWPAYIMRKLFRRPHWQIKETRLLSHPGCLLSYRRPYPQMLDSVRQAIARSELTVLVTHWWEYFRDGRPDEAFISQLHRTAEMLANDPEVRVVTFDDVASKGFALN